MSSDESWGALVERLKRTRRRVLRPSVTEDDIKALAESCHWELWASVPHDIAAAQNHEVQWRVDNALLLSYLESYLTTDGCVLALGGDVVETERFMHEEVDSVFELAIYEESDLLGNIDVAGDEGDLPRLGRALIQAGLGAPLSHDREFFELIVAKSTAHANYHIRVIAICSMVYTEWPEFVPVLRDVLHNDSDERVRDRAQIVLNAYAAAGLAGES